MDTVITCDDLDAAIDHYTQTQGYRLDMIVPADSPRAALLSNGDDTIRLEKCVPPAVAGGVLAPGEVKSPPATAGGTDWNTDWIMGRAGMEYRDVIPGRLDGKVIASHIRLTKGGEVSDYVHYHKVQFQVIYCKRGRIRVVYEDQGPPFWLETGDCVLQPPEIRHRVLECTANAEVIEISMPAEHETWVEHDIKLPTADIKAGRNYGGQRFVHHIAADASWIRGDAGEFEMSVTAISTATGAFGDVRVLRSPPDITASLNATNHADFLFYFVLTGSAFAHIASGFSRQLTSGDGIVIPNGAKYSITAADTTEILAVCIKRGENV